MRQQTELQPQFHAEIMNLIQRENDFLTVALKGHLYAEYWLEQAMIAAWGSGAVKITNFTFAQKLKLVQGTGLITNEPLVKGLEGLNQIRNAIAHNLFPDHVELANKLPRFQDDYTMQPYLPDKFTDQHEWALVYLKVSVIVICIPLIMSYYVPKNREAGAQHWADELKRIALEELRPKTKAFK